MPTPRPGRPVRGSRTGRPLMAALDLLGRRWSMRVIWELRDGPLGFRPLQHRCDDMSSSVLRVRLAELESAGLVGRTEDAGYVLTDIGRKLNAAIRPLTNWADTWAESLAPDESTGGRRTGADVNRIAP
jgi:DNA-binding HxlR family transcriptional regulator